MPCEPGSTPVAMHVQDTSVCGGEHTSNREYPPCSTNLDKFGICPAACSRSKVPGSNESNPRIIVFIYIYHSSHNVTLTHRPERSRRGSEGSQLHQMPGSSGERHPTLRWIYSCSSVLSLRILRRSVAK